MSSSDRPLEANEIETAARVDRKILAARKKCNSSLPYGAPGGQPATVASGVGVANPGASTSDPGTLQAGPGAGDNVEAPPSSSSSTSHGGMDPGTYAKLRCLPVSEYHRALKVQFGQETRAQALHMIERCAGLSSVSALEKILPILQLRAEWTTLDRSEGSPLLVVSLTPTYPPLVFMGETRDLAAEDAISHIKLLF